MLNETVINGLLVKYSVIPRNIKYPRLELRTGNLVLVVPKGYSSPEKLIEEHKNWIYNKLSAINNSKERSIGKKLNYERFDADLREYVLFIIDEISQDLKVKPNRVSLRLMKSKWGSCSSKKNLNFNKLLKYLPDELIEYVVLHEMAHLVEKKHNNDFWKIISDRINDYAQKEQDLMDYWFLINQK